MAAKKKAAKKANAGGDKANGKRKKFATVLAKLTKDYPDSQKRKALFVAGIAVGLPDEEILKVAREQGFTATPASLAYVREKNKQQIADARAL
jgi:hypothetical protein